MLATELQVGDTAIIKKLAKSDYRKRLLALGLLPGASIAIIRCAPMGDPVEITVKNTSVSLRREELKCIEVDKE